MPGAPAMRAALLGGVFSPASLFAMGEQGVWYDPSDLSTMFQDTAGTIPVTTPGQTVALILDKSGRGNHASQATAASRPVYQIDGSGKSNLGFDGIDDFLVVPAFAPGSDKVQVVTGVRKLSDAAVSCLIEASNASNLNPGTVAVFAPLSASPVGRYGARMQGTAITSALPVGSTGQYLAPITNILSFEGDIASGRRAARVNGALRIAETIDLGTGNFLGYQLFIGRRGGTILPFNGQIHGLILRFGPNLSAYQIRAAENYMNQKTGAW